MATYEQVIQAQRDAQAQGLWGPSADSVTANMLGITPDQMSAILTAGPGGTTSGYSTYDPYSSVNLTGYGAPLPGGTPGSGLNDMVTALGDINTARGAVNTAGDLSNFFGGPNFSTGSLLKGGWDALTGAGDVGASVGADVGAGGLGGAGGVGSGVEGGLSSLDALAGAGGAGVTGATAAGGIGAGAAADLGVAGGMTAATGAGAETLGGAGLGAAGLGEFAPFAGPLMALVMGLMSSGQNTALDKAQDAKMRAGAAAIQNTPNAASVLTQNFAKPITFDPTGENVMSVGANNPTLISGMPDYMTIMGLEGNIHGQQGGPGSLQQTLGVTNALNDWIARGNPANPVNVLPGYGEVTPVFNPATGLTTTGVGGTSAYQGFPGR